MKVEIEKAASKEEEMALIKVCEMTDDIQSAVDILHNDCRTIPVMQGTGGLRKIRVSRENEGKSGGARVCYVDFVVEKVIYLITVYLKNQKDNLTQTECNNIKKMIQQLKLNLSLWNRKETDV